MHPTLPEHHSDPPYGLVRRNAWRRICAIGVERYVVLVYLICAVLPAVVYFVSLGSLSSNLTVHPAAVVAVSVSIGAVIGGLNHWQCTASRAYYARELDAE